MLRMNSDDGRLWVDECGQPLAPRMSYYEFRRHPLFSSMPPTGPNAPNQQRHQFPRQFFEETPIEGQAEWINHQLVALWFQPFPEDCVNELCRFERGDDRILAFQERWVRSWGITKLWGSTGEEYSWGTVWPRFNIHAEFHDIAVFFSNPKSSKGGA